MALIMCPKCGETISDKVVICPNCNALLNNNVTTQKPSKYNLGCGFVALIFAKNCFENGVVAFCGIGSD